MKTTPVKEKTTKRSTKKAEKKISFKGSVLDTLQPVRSKFNNAINKIKNPSKKAKRTTKAELKLKRQQRLRGILGIGLLLVVVSIAYSTSVIYIGVDSSASRIALFPQVLFALLTLFKAFSKLYK